MNRRGVLKLAGYGAVGCLAARPALPAGPGRQPPLRESVRPGMPVLEWQRDELSMFVHFGINTYTGREWGEGNESPALFAPDALDARQWARVARMSGFRSMILTAKHHDGFCLWPTATTRHSVASSPWRDGHGDVVREFVDACTTEGLKAGLYLSPWDRNAPSYGTPQYDELYIAQLEELLTRYGPVHEVWFDGANGEGPQGRPMRYAWPRIFATVKRLQPDAVIFSDAGPDVRWIGNERGMADTTCWSTIDPARVPHPGFFAPWLNQALQQGDPYGSVWRPGESDVSIRPGWFWRPEEDAKVRSASDLFDLYLASVGRNSKLLLNVPPTTRGVFAEADIAALRGFAALRRTVLADRSVLNGSVIAASVDARGARQVVGSGSPAGWSAGSTRGWISFELPQPRTIAMLDVQEAIVHGQHISNHRWEHWQNGAWLPLAWGTTIGHRRMQRIAPVQVSRLRLHIDHAYGTARIARVGAYADAENAVSTS